jgi:hypothetical protein
MHLECLEEQVRLVSHALLEALVFGSVKVILQNGLVLRVRTILDDHASTLAWGEATDIRKTLHASDQIRATSQDRSEIAPVRRNWVAYLFSHDNI